MVKKKDDILSTKDVFSVNPSSLNFIYKVFTQIHVPEIVLPKIHNFDITYLTTKGNLLELSLMFCIAICHIS